MRLTLSPKYVLFFTIVFVFQVTIIFLFNYYAKGITQNVNFSPSSYSLWSNFKIFMKNDCLGSSFEDFNMEKFVTYLKKLKSSSSPKCEEIYKDFNKIFEVTHRYSEPINVPSPFMKKMQRNLDNKLYEALFHQLLIHVFNRLTFESSTYNPVRSRRPMMKGKENIWNYIDKISKETEKGCDFCSYKHQTATDQLGRHETDFTVRIANSFKVEKWHGMIITKKHHPTNFSQLELEMMMNEVVRWAKDVNDRDPHYIYASASWDVLYKAGASQLHPHIHVILSPNHYFGSMEQYRAAAELYFKDTGQNLFSKLVEIYSALGLAVPYGDAVAMATLVGKGDLEVMILSDSPSSDLFSLFYFTLKVYHDLGFPCHSMAMAWPPIVSSIHSNYGKIPALLRVMVRGDCLSNVNDMSSLDLFLTNYRDHDPWFLARQLRRKVADQTSFNSDKGQI